jgi:hypothetical protein
VAAPLSLSLTIAVVTPRCGFFALLYRMVKGERKCFEAAWAEMRPPLWMYGRHMSLAGLLWTASDQLRLTKAEKGVETVLRFMQHCLQGQLISGGTSTGNLSQS